MSLEDDLRRLLAQARRQRDRWGPSGGQNYLIECGKIEAFEAAIDLIVSERAAS